LASTATSSACFGANPGKAMTEAPRSINVAKAESDLTIWAADFLISNPSALGDRHYYNNQNENTFRQNNLLLIGVVGFVFCCRPKDERLAPNGCFRTSPLTNVAETGHSASRQSGIRNERAHH
jgi:hypothetical protein